jgi:hypothetical protein
LLAQERYWEWRHQPEKALSYDESVDRFAEVFDEVMEDLLAEGLVAVPISGGLDSRTTISVLGTTDKRPWTYSYGYAEDSVETRIAAQVAKSRSLPFASITIRPYLFERLDTVLASVEGFQDVTQSRQACVVDELGRRATHVIAAHWGDVWLDDMGLVDVQSGSELRSEEVCEHARHKLEKRGRGWLLNHLCEPHTGRNESESILNGIVHAEMSKLDAISDPDFRVKALKTESWSFRWTTASLRMFQPGAFPRLPFYDTRLTDFFCTLPSRYVSGRRLQIDYLKRYAPDLARIVWQVYDANLYTYHRSHSWHLPRRAIKKIWRLISGQRPIERNWEVQLMSNAGREGLRHWLVRDGLKINHIVQSEAIETLLTAFYADPLQDGRAYTVCMLLTFSAWLERYA